MAAPAPEFDCRQCGLPLVFLRSKRSPVGYYRCPRCDRQFATTYAGELSAAAAPHASPEAREAARARDRELRGWREKLDGWLARAEKRDPFAALGLRHDATLAEARERFHALALEHHPDRGGDAERMRALIEAYDLVRDRLAKSARAPAATPPARPASGLARRGPPSWARARAKEELA